MKKSTTQLNTLRINGNFYTHLVSIFKIVTYISERNLTNLIDWTIGKELQYGQCLCSKPTTTETSDLIFLGSDMDMQSLAYIDHLIDLVKSCSWMLAVHGFENAITSTLYW